MATRMTHEDTLGVVAAHRGERIVISTMTSVGVWSKLSNSPLDFAYIPSSMGHAPGLGLGLALAQPKRGVIVLNGDGSMLMNLGSLVTIASQPAELFLIIFDNGLYEVTGGQPTAGAGQVDFAAVAQAAGLRRTYTFANLPDWCAGAAEALVGPGPVAICLKVEGRLGQKTPAPPMPMSQQVERFRNALSQHRYCPPQEPA